MSKKKIPDYKRISNLEKENSSLKIELKAMQLWQNANVEGSKYATDPTAYDPFKYEVQKAYEVTGESQELRHKLRLDDGESMRYILRENKFLLAKKKEPKKEEGSTLSQTEMASMSGQELFRHYIDSEDSKT